MLMYILSVGVFLWELMILELLPACFISWATGTPSQDVSLWTHSLWGLPFSFLFLFHPLSPSRWPCLTARFPITLWARCSLLFHSLGRQRDSFTSIFVCTQGQETYTLWRICHVIPSQSLSQRSPWSHWTPRAKVRQHQLKSLRPRAVPSWAVFFPVLTYFLFLFPTFQIWCREALRTAHFKVSLLGFQNWEVHVSTQIELLAFSHICIAATHRWFV